MTLRSTADLQIELAQLISQISQFQSEVPGHANIRSQLRMAERRKAMVEAELKRREVQGQ